jgi:hypothetical protein
MVIHSFCIRNTADDWKRCFVCGICWLSPNEIGVNPRQLHHLLGRSKSSINGVLALLNYKPLSTRRIEAQRLSQAFPWLETHSTERRLWTIRKLPGGENEPSDVAPDEEGAGIIEEKELEGSLHWPDDGHWDEFFFADL